MKVIPKPESLDSLDGQLTSSTVDEKKNSRASETKLSVSCPKPVALQDLMHALKQKWKTKRGCFIYTSSTRIFFFFLRFTALRSTRLLTHQHVTHNVFAGWQGWVSGEGGVGVSGRGEIGGGERPGQENNKMIVQRRKAINKIFQHLFSWRSPGTTHGLVATWLRPRKFHEV